jgi:hypothetical protein
MLQTTLNSENKLSTAIYCISNDFGCSDKANYRKEVSIMKKLLFILVAMISMVSLVKSVQADMGWYEATINYAGTNSNTPDRAYINATSTNNSWPGSYWFVTDGEAAKTALAVALTAWSTGGPVMIILDDADLNNYSDFYGIFAAPAK